MIWYGSGQLDSCYEREDGAGTGSVGARDACASKMNLVRANLYFSTIYADKTISFWGRYEWFGVKLSGIVTGMSYLMSWNPRSPKI